MWKDKFNQAIDGQETVPTFKQITHRIRKSLPLQSASKTTATAFANESELQEPPTFQEQHRKGRTEAPNQPHAGPHQGSSRGRNTKPCGYCGLVHVISDPAAPWRDCYYCVPSKAPSWFRFNEEVQERVKQNIEATGPEVKRAIQAADNKGDKPSTEKTGQTPDVAKSSGPRVFMTLRDDAALNSTSNRLLVDSGASDHIFNDVSWFLDLDTTVTKTLITGVSKITSAATGTAQFKASTGQIIRLENVLYVPTFPLNFISL